MRIGSHRPGPAFALGLLLVGGLIAGAYGLSGLLARAGGHATDPAELTLFPTGRWVRPATLGRARLAADLAWLEAIQYYGRHRKLDRRYPYAETLFRTLTDLDPGFQSAYLFGALVLHGDVQDPRAAFALLAKGIEKNPQSWRLVFEYGFLAFLESKSSHTAAQFLGRAARMPGAPDWVCRLAAYAAGKAGERDLSLALWREVLRTSENEEVRRIARRSLRALGAPEAASFADSD